MSDKSAKEVQEKAFEFTRIAGFILAATPMIRGYAAHNSGLAVVVGLADDIGGDTGIVVDSEKWAKIKAILDI